MKELSKEQLEAIDELGKDLLSFLDEEGNAQLIKLWQRANAVSECLGISPNGITDTFLLPIYLMCSTQDKKKVLASIKATESSLVNKLVCNGINEKKARELLEL